MFAPTLTIISALAVLTLALWRRDRRLPILDIGVFALLMTVLYSIFPVLQFMAGGEVWEEGSDPRLRAINPGAEEIGTFLWGTAVYALVFVSIYLPLRGRGVPHVPIRPEYADVVTIVGVIALAFVLRLAVQSIYSVSLLQSNEEIGEAPAFAALPHVVAQVTAHALTLARTARIVLIIALIAFWRRGWAKLLLAGLISYEVIDVVVRQGQRTSAVLLMLAAVLAYHRLVRPLRFAAAALAGLGILGAAIIYGLMREIGAERLNVVTSNDFQAMMGTPFHVAHLIDLGAIGEIPWQLYLSDLLMLIPQQILPIAKIDPATWYLQQAGYDEGTGWMFGLMSQAAIGGGIAELALRGAALALVLATIHRFCAKRAQSFWVSVFYIWLCTVIYYTYRASTFYWITFVVFHFLPLVAAAKIVRLVQASAPRRTLQPA